MNQTHPEIEFFIFKTAPHSDDELDKRLELEWVYRNPNEVLYLAVKKNRNFYEEYSNNPEKYEAARVKWHE